MKTSNSTLLFSLLLLIIYWSLTSLSAPSSPVQNSVALPAALTSLKELSKAPHFTGSSGQKDVKNYLIKALQELGLKPEVQEQMAFNSKWKAAATVKNIIATIKGSGHGKALLLLSHYDSNPHSSLGASDAGSGLVTILEGLKAFLKTKKQPHNDIIILFTDGEELGLLGAEAFVKHHPLAQNIGLVLNFEARGSGGPSYMLMETNGKNSKLLSEFLNASPNYPAANSLMYSIYKMLPNDTDLTVFREKGNINGFNFAFIGDHFDYHTAQDSFERLDQKSLVHQIDYLTTTLSYFSESNINNLNSNTDDIYFNFPFIKLVTFPFSWLGYLLVGAILLFIGLLIIGIQKNKLHTHNIIKGFIPFIGSIATCGITAVALWELLILIHPQYQDMLHGFTYNGYWYIFAFIFLGLWICITFYNYFKNETTLNLLIAPITIWLTINVFIFFYIKGAGFFIVPVFIALFIGYVYLFTHLKKRNHSFLFLILSLPSLYIFVPLIKMFPVGLGLKNLYISSILLALLFGVMLPVLHQYKTRIPWQKLLGFSALITLLISSFFSGFSTDKKKPNSLVYTQNQDTKTAFWGTYNTVLDQYTKQIFNANYEEGSIETAETKSKYNTVFKFHKKTTYKILKNADVHLKTDTIVNKERHVSVLIKPKRPLNKLELFNKSSVDLVSLRLNSVVLYTNQIIKEGTLFIYHMDKDHQDVHLEIILKEGESLDIIMNEISYDLLSHPNFNLTPRSDVMMPMPFVTNDAIINTRQLKF